ncbi:MAG: hypothetical protein DMF56_06015 [Acidobacteria bacterium]|nr:MAG: hypothetical protein DMF56_06015 [Acidobacteriota bacterium]
MRWSWVVLATFVFSASLQAQSAQSTQKLLESEAAKLRAWGSDPVIVAAVKAQNAKKVPLATIQSLDKQWIAGKAETLVKQIITGTCADHLRQLAATNTVYGEIFVMDNQGANVCASDKTSDYWQGDEAKWQRAFAAGKGDVFIDRPRYDDSASRNLAQISVPVMDGGRAIGAITIGLTVR